MSVEVWHEIKTFERKYLSICTRLKLRRFVTLRYHMKSLLSTRKIIKYSRLK